MDERTEQRFWAKVDKTGDCWIWMGSLTDAGYGTFTVSRSKRGLAHRFAYELLVGPIPSGLELDHLCRRPACVSPAHLEPVTHRENLLRGRTIVAWNAVKTECIRGHPFDAANTYIEPKGKRRCRTCHREDERQRRKLGI
jgi:hypothetical protein